MQEFILNGKTVKVAPEHIEAFVKANPMAETKKPGWWKKETSFTTDPEKGYVSKEDHGNYQGEQPGKSQGASQPQQNQQQDMGLSSETGSAGLVKYRMGNKIVKVNVTNTKLFEEQNPDAIIADFPKGTHLDTWTDENDNIPEDGGFMNDFTLALKQGKRGLSVEEAFDIMRRGNNVDDATIESFIKDIEEVNNIQEPEAVREFKERKEAEGGGIWGNIVAAAKDPFGAIDYGLLEVTKSISTMAHSLGSGSEEMLAAAGTGAAGGYGVGKKFGAGKYGAISGAYSAGIGAMESGLEFSQLLQDELKTLGVDPNDFENGFTAGNVRVILNDAEAMERMKQKAIARGMSIALVEALTFGVARGVGTSVLNKTASKGVTAAAVTGTEMVGGATGEAVGQFTSGGIAEQDGFSVQKGFENMDSEEIFLEGILEGPTAIFNTDIILDNSKGRKYKINGGDVNKKRVLSIVNSKYLSTAEKAKVLNSTEITNDDTLKGIVDKALNDANVELNIDAIVTDPADRKRLVELENKRLKAEQDLKKSGVFAVPGARKDFDDINSKIEEILAPYQGQVDPNSAEAQTIEQDAAEFNQDRAERMFKSNLEFAKKHSALYGLKYNDTLTREEIRKAYGDEAADSDGFVYEDQMIINTQVAQFTGAVNVGNHELLHGILRKSMKANPNQFTNIRQDLSQQIGAQWATVEKRVEIAGYTEEYMTQNPDEWITLTSDAIAVGDITYNESVFQPLMDFILPILRAAGFKKIKFNTGKDVFEFLKEYNRSIHKGSLSSGIVSATADTTIVPDEMKFAKSNLAGMLDRFDGDTRRMINQTVRKNADGRPVTYREDKFKNYIATIDSEFGQEIMPIVQNITQRLFDPIPTNIADDAGVSRQSYQADLINEAATLVNNEYNGRQPLDQFVSNRLNLRAQSLARRLGIKTAEQTSQETKIDQGDTQIQVQDTTQPEADFDTQDLSLQTQIQKKKGLLKTKKKAQFVASNLNFKEDTVTPIRSSLEKINYDVDNKLYEDVKEDMMSQANPNETSKNRVQPTGVLYPILETISTNEFGVNPNSILAKPQTLTNPESIAARTKIAEVMERIGPKEFINSILPNVNFNPKSGKAIGINTKLLKEFYVDGKMRVPNLYGKALNVDRMANTDILMVFGINPDFTLMPAERKYDGAVKGVITQASVFAANQEARSLVNNQAAEVGVGKPAMMFAKSLNRGNDMTATDFARFVKEKTGSPLPFIMKYKGDKSQFRGIYNPETEETFYDRKYTVTRDFLNTKDNMKFREIHRLMGMGGISRSTFGVNDEYNANVPKAPKGVEVISNPRFYYNSKLKQKSGIAKLTEKQKLIEDRKLDNLRDYFIAVQEWLQSNPNDAWLWISFLQDSGAAGMGHSVRTHFKNGFYTVDQRTRKLNTTDNMREEHSTPANDVHGMLLYAAIENNVKETFVGIRSIAMQGPIKIAADDIINDGSKNIYGVPEKLKSKTTKILFDKILPRVLNGDLSLPDGIAAIVRMAVQGVNLNELMLREPADTTFTEYFGVGVDIKNLTDNQIEFLVPLQNELIVKQLTGVITKTKAKNTIKKFSDIVVKTSKADIKKSLNSRKSVLQTFNQIAENRKKQNQAIQADLEKRGYTFVDKPAEPITTTFEKIAGNRKKANDIIQADLEARGYKFSKGMSTFDFDETLIIDGENFVVATNPNTGETQNVKSGEWPLLGPELADQGYTFNFDDFVNVRGGVDGPLLQKMKNQIAKYGPKNVFVLTARPQTSDTAIHGWLESKGINIPFKNITGLGDGKGEAKARWMLEKFSEGYNDMYFVDDALPNVEAVKTVLDQLDIKSKVVQAKIKFSKTASENFNTILEESQGTSRSRTFSAAEAKKTGQHKGWWRIFIPPSAEDFRGLLYRFLGKGQQGNMHMKYFKIKLLDPFAKGIRAWNIYKQEMVNEYKQLRKSLPNVTKILNYTVEGTPFTVDTAIRVYLWNKHGHTIPGLDEATKNELIDFVNNDTEVKGFADVLSNITRTQQGYVAPDAHWSLGTISMDLNNVVNKVGRKEFLAEYLHNAEAIFTPENMNKIEALYGTGFREALENIMYRMENGGNRLVSPDRQVNRLYNWINGSIGAIMFFNMRSAILQTISTVNFINWSDNNIFKASAAFANQPQFWKDFAMIFNSPMLKQRRTGIQIDVSASELSRAFKEGRGKAQGVISWLLEKGFTPTQIADSMAISFGGATLYRNRLNTYLKQGFSEVEANEKAMLDFQEVAEETQQSSREDLISKQQASVIGRLILAFQNVTMQYTRLTKKALSDLINGRGDWKTNMSKIIYYGAVQNIVFASLQTALAFMLWGDDEEEIENKTQRVANSALDSFLRGTGLYGAIISTAKNTIIQHNIQNKKDWNREDGRTLLEIVNFSPPIGSKLRKIYNAIKTEQYNKGVSEEIGFRIENPTLYKWASVIEAVTNVPTQRIVKKVNNLEEAITGNHLTWQKIALALGWSKWEIGVKDEELEQAKKDAKNNKTSDKKKNKREEEERLEKEGYKRVQCSGTNSVGNQCGLYSDLIKAKSWKCSHHKDFKDGDDRDGDGVKEYRCTATKTNGKRCKNKTENKNKRCYAHQ